MKKMPLATALALPTYRMCSTDVYCSKQTGSSSTKTITHHFFVSGIGEETVDAAKICGSAKCFKNEASKHLINGLLGFYARHLYSAGSACVLLTIIA